MYYAEKKLSLRDMTYSGMFAAVIAVLAQVAVPTPSGVSLTLQTFAAAAAGYTLGVRRGTLAAIVYVLLGAAGAPVFACLKGGLSVLTGPSGGFIWGFIAMALLCGAGSASESRIKGIALGLAGLAVCHICGVLQFAVIRGGGVFQSFITVSLPYLLKDAVSVTAAYAAAKVIRKRVRIINE